METVQDLKMKLYIQTNKRMVEEEFESLFDMKAFMDRFFSEMAQSKALTRPSVSRNPKARVPS